MKKFINSLFSIFDKPKTERRVVVTGIGVISPVGIGIDNFWSNLKAGKSGIKNISLFDASEFPCQVAGEIIEFNPNDFLNKKQQKYFSRAGQFACSAFKLAQQNANLTEFDPYRTDIILGAASCSLNVVSDQVDNDQFRIGEYDNTFDPVFLPKYFMNGPTSAIGLMAKTKGLMTTVSSACSSGLTSLGMSYERIIDGHSDVVITGAVDTPINKLFLHGFCSAGMLTENNKNPSKALCPFDIKRDKSALGEGSVIFILESADHAIARGATVYAEVLKFNQEHENINELYFPDKSGLSWAETIKTAIEGHEHSITYVNAHGPSDKIIDVVESTAIKIAFQEKISKKIPVISIKGYVGSGLAVAGGFQLASSLMSIKSGYIPKSSNYDDPDPKCTIPILANQKPKQSINKVLVNSHALGGTNASILLGKFSL